MEDSTKNRTDSLKTLENMLNIRMRDHKDPRIPNKSDYREIFGEPSKFSSATDSMANNLQIISHKMNKSSIGKFESGKCFQSGPSTLTADENLPSSGEKRETICYYFTDPYDFRLAKHDKPSLHRSDENISICSNIKTNYQDITFYCEVCLEDIKFNNMATFPCNHKICYECCVKYLYHATLEGNSHNIPCVNCEVKLSDEFLSHFILRSDLEMSNDLKPMFQKIRQSLQKFRLTNILSSFPDFLWCSGPDCGFGFFADLENCKSSYAFRCPNPKCCKIFCLVCRNDAHPGEQCHDSIKRNIQSALQNDLTRKSINSVSQNNSGRRDNFDDVMEVKCCPTCLHPYTKISDGSCNHMTCKFCSTEFCWICEKKVGFHHFMGASGCTLYAKKRSKLKKSVLINLLLALLSPVGFAIWAVALLFGTIFLFPRMTYRHTKKHLVESRNVRFCPKSLAIGTGFLIFSPVVFSFLAVISGVAVFFGVYLMMPYQIISRKFNIDFSKKSLKSKNDEIIEFDCDLNSWFDHNTSSDNLSTFTIREKVST